MQIDFAGDDPLTTVVTRPPVASHRHVLGRPGWHQHDLAPQQRLHRPPMPTRVVPVDRPTPRRVAAQVPRRDQARHGNVPDRRGLPAASRSGNAHWPLARRERRLRPDSCAVSAWAACRRLNDEARPRAEERAADGREWPAALRPPRRPARPRSACFTGRYAHGRRPITPFSSRAASTEDWGSGGVGGRERRGETSITGAHVSPGAGASRAPRDAALDSRAAALARYRARRGAKRRRAGPRGAAGAGNKGAAAQGAGGRIAVRRRRSRSLLWSLGHRARGETLRAGVRDVDAIRSSSRRAKGGQPAATDVRAARLEPRASSARARGGRGGGSFGRFRRRRRRRRAPKRAAAADAGSGQAARASTG